MSNKNIPFQTINWSDIPKTEHKGDVKQELHIGRPLNLKDYGLE